MFSLIITIISIALVAALALATLYYGGSAFNKGSAGATAARLINEGQQINGAVAVLKADLASGAAAAGWTVTAANEATATLESLAPAYMSQLPANWTKTTVLGLNEATPTRHVAEVNNALVTGAVCEEVNRRAGLSAAPADDTAGVYGCIPGASGAPGTFFYAF